MISGLYRINLSYILSTSYTYYIVYLPTLSYVNFLI